MSVGLECPSSGSRTWGSEGGDGMSSSHLIHSMQPALVSISSDGGPCTGQERALGFISSSRGGRTESCAGCVEGGKGALQSSTAQFEPEHRAREGRGRERGEGPPFWNVNDGVFWFLLGVLLTRKVKRTGEMS